MAAAAPAHRSDLSFDELAKILHVPKPTCHLYEIPIGPIVVPFGGSYFESYKVTAKKNYYGAYGYSQKLANPNLKHQTLNSLQLDLNLSPALCLQLQAMRSHLTSRSVRGYITLT